MYRPSLANIGKGTDRRGESEDLVDAFRRHKACDVLASACAPQIISMQQLDYVP